jgi:hypothetical protein
VSALSAIVEEKEKATKASERTLSRRDDLVNSLHREVQQLKELLRESEFRLQALTNEMEKIKASIDVYSRHIQNTPAHRRNVVATEKADFMPPFPSLKTQTSFESSLLPASGFPLSARQSQPVAPSEALSWRVGTDRGGAIKPQAKYRPALGSDLGIQAQVLPLKPHYSMGNQQATSLAAPLNGQMLDRTVHLHPPPSNLASSGLVPEPTSIRPAKISPVAEMANSNASTVVPSQGKMTGFNFIQDYQRITGMVKSWANAHAGTPSPNDQDLPEELLNTFSSYTTYNMLSKLMSSSESRQLIVVRYIAETMTQEVLKIHVVKGFNELEEPMHQTTDMRSKPTSNLPQSNKAAECQVQADAVYKIRQSPNLPGWLHQRGAESVKPVFNALKPVLSGNLSQAYNDLGFIWAEAHRLAVDMHCLPHLYRFDFINAGPTSFFNPSTMINLDPKIRGRGMELRKAEYKVNVCITPVVIVTEFQNLTIIPRTVQMAEVLLIK